MSGWGASARRDSGGRGPARARSRGRGRRCDRRPQPPTEGGGRRRAVVPRGGSGSAWPFGLLSGDRRRLSESTPTNGAGQVGNSGVKWGKVVGEGTAPDAPR